jgi:hypothetical protein
MSGKYEKKIIKIIKIWMYDDEVNYDDDDNRYLYHLCYCCNNKVNIYINKIKKFEH